MIRILEFDNYSKEALSIYRQIGPVLTGYQCESPDFSTEILVCRLRFYIDKSVLNDFPNTRVIVSPTTGTTHLDMNEVVTRGIEVLTLRDARNKISQIRSTPELALLLALSINRRLGCYYSDLLTSCKTEIMRDDYLGNEVSERSIGILGCGRTGKALYNYARHIWGKAFTWDINPAALLDIPSSSRCESLSSLLQSVDTLCVCVDLNDTSYNLLSYRELSMMARGSYIVNTSRGEIINESALQETIITGQIGGYATDVWREEYNTIPDPRASKLWELVMSGYNIMLTPHIGGCTIQAMHRTEVIMAEMLYSRHALSGGFSS